MRATGTRFFIVGLLGLFMFIPLFFAGAVINDRAGYSRDASRTIAEEWGGAQVLRGPQLIVPVVETVTEQRRVDLIDEITDLPQRDARSGDVLYRVEEVEREEERAAVYLLPEKFDVDLTTQSDIRRRGIFRVPVYRATAAIDFDFDTEAVEGALRD
ncbi:MAG: inner membrane CreD family protein, partial [Pseudomonadota bacterium]